MHEWLHSEILKGRSHFGELGVDGRIILQGFLILNFHRVLSIVNFL